MNSKAILVKKLLDHAPLDQDDHNMIVLMCDGDESIRPLLQAPRLPVQTTSGPRPRVTAHTLVKVQQLRSSGFDLDAMQRDLKAQGADAAKVVDSTEACADRAAR